MKALHLSCFIASVALASTGALASADDQPIDVNTDGLPSHVAEQVREHAAQSEQALMQYLWFSRRMHHLWLDDVTKPRADSVAQDEKTERHQVVLMHPHGFR
jgi:hypothetical protein